MMLLMQAVGQSPRSGRAACQTSAAGARAHLNALHALPGLLDGFGENADLILGCAGLTREHFDDPDLSASFADLDRLLHVCVTRTGCQHFGLLLGRHVTLESFGLVGRLARHATTVGDSLADLARFFTLHDSGGTLQVSVTGEQALLSYGIRVSGLRCDCQIHDLSAAACCSIMRQLCGARFQPREVLLPHRRPPDPRPYAQAFGVPVRFDAMQCGIVFSPRLLSQPVAGADAMLHSLLQDCAASAVIEVDPLLYRDVRRAITDGLAAGDCSRASVARRLGLHERALGRRLQAAGTTFQALYDELRLQLAQQLLHDTDAPVARIAASIGFRDSTVFSRAFRRWTGMNPREFRARVDRRH